MPKFKNIDRLSKLSNIVIKKLQMEKRKILTLIKKHPRLQHILSDYTFHIAKAQLKNIKKLLAKNLRISINKRIESNLSTLNPKEMFGEII